MFDISVSSSIVRDGKRGGSLFEKKSFNAVATALTGMSNSLMETPGSTDRDSQRKRKKKTRK
jgi:hypothetical protein